MTIYGWVTEEEANAYMGTRYGASDPWSSGVDKAAALTTAYNDLTGDSRLSLPTTATSVMKSAQMEQALFIVQQDASLDARQGIQVQGVGTSGLAKEQYRSNAGNSTAISSRAMNFLKDYFVGDSTFLADIGREDDYAFDQD